MGDDEKTLTVAHLSPKAAAVALAGMAVMDPRGLIDDNGITDMCASGQCFEIAGGAASAVYVLSTQNGVVWVNAAKGCGDCDVFALLDGLITEQSRGAAAIAFQTKRRGLVKKAQRHGYRVTGWIMRKELS